MGDDGAVWERIADKALRGTGKARVGDGGVGDGG